jgi:hypothetical protein
LSRLFRRAQGARTFLAALIVAAGAVAVADPKPAASAPSPTTFTAVADARVQQKKPSTNYGQDPLRVEYDATAGVTSYLKFTTSGLAAPVQSAKLRLRVSSNGSAQGASLHTTGTGWTESGLTWQNAPARTALLGTVSKLPASSWVEFDVTSAVTGNGTFAFVLSKTSGSDGADVHSREQANGPQLVVTVADTTVPTPPTATTPTTVAPATGPGGTFKPEADARVEQKKPSSNFDKEPLRVEYGSGAAVNSYLKFTTSGLSTPVTGAKLRVWVGSNGSTQGASLHSTGTGWTEKNLTWKTAPAKDALLGRVAKIPKNSWVEFDVTSAVTGNGTFAFVLSKTSGSDGADLKSREQSNAPELVVTTAVPTTTTTSSTTTSTSTSTTTTLPLVLEGTGATVHTGRARRSARTGAA